MAKKCNLDISGWGTFLKVYFHKFKQNPFCTKMIPSTTRKKCFINFNFIIQKRLIFFIMTAYRAVLMLVYLGCPIHKTILRHSHFHNLQFPQRHFPHSIGKRHPPTVTFPPLINANLTWLNLTYLRKGRWGKSSSTHYLTLPTREVMLASYP